MRHDDGLRSIFHDHLRGDDVHWVPVETGDVVMGVPDSNVAFLGGVETWVEYKATRAWSVGISPMQIGWHKRRSLLGHVSFIAVRRRHGGGPRKGPAVDELWLCRGRYAPILNREGLQCPDIMWEGCWSGGPAAWGWGAVRQALERAGEPAGAGGRGGPVG